MMTTQYPIYIALDPSSTNVGWCVSQGERYIESGVFSPRLKSPDERVYAIHIWAKGLIEKYDPDFIVMEEPAGDHGNRKTDRLLARVGATIEAVAFDFGMHPPEIIRIYPQTIKRTGVHKHNRAYAALLANKRKVGEDEADAIGASIAGWNIIAKKRFSNGLNP